jgi:hypothetical protein
MSRYQSCSPGIEDLLDLHLLEDVGAEVELDRIAELGQVAPEG